MHLHMASTPANMIPEGIIQMRLILSFWKGINWILRVNFCRDLQQENGDG